MNTEDARISRLRRDLLTCFQAGLSAVDGRTRVYEVLSERRPAGRAHVVAIGKAAAAMSRGALDAWKAGVERGLAITKKGHLSSALLRDRRFTCIESSHPVPNGRSLQAGRALLDFVAQTPDTAELVFLISGGASSLVEVPRAGVSVLDLARVNRWLLASGLEIAAMNSVRQGLSAIKGGRLNTRLHGRRVTALLISDVQGDDPAVIGSGLLVPGDRDGWRSLALPDWVVELLQQGAPSGNAETEPAVTKSSVAVHIIASLERALAAAAERGRGLGYAVHGSSQFQRGDACAVGRRLADVLAQGAPGMYLWGGETTVQLPPQPGRGGRCQALALCAAQQLAGLPHVALLAAGTDGTDGPGEDAGALVDGGTIQRGTDGGLDAAACAAAADAGAFLEAAGDLVQTGPTGTNVMDLMIGGRVD